MSERETTWAMLNRVSALCDRITAHINRRIQTRTDLGKLDELFNLGERSLKLYWRVNARHDASRPQWLKEFWESTNEQ